MEQTQSGRMRPGVWVAGAAVLVVFVVLAGLGYQAYRDWARGAPGYPSLADSPDADLVGTIAYYDAATQCVRLMDASAGRSADVYCLDGTPEGTGRINGPQLAWRPDGRLEVTAFDWPQGEEPTSAWQVLVDATTGDVEEVPDGDLPEAPPVPPAAAIGPDGQQATLTLRDNRLVIELIANGESRTLLTSEKYSTDFGLTPSNELLWSPDGQYLVFSDGRLLLTTTEESSTTRIVVESPGSFGCCYASLGVRSYAVTDATLVIEGS
ncbi:MAG: hypothetical protein OEV60_06530 [Actinomycetota bacterium]|nr:hypothetical protein [Actinomycetota bacterium]